MGNKAIYGRMQRSLAIWAAALFFAFAMATATPAAAGERISAARAFELTQSGAVTLVDVRSVGEWRQTGLPAGAKAVTIHNPQGLEGFLADMLTAVDGDRSRPVALICAVGGRSARATRYLEEHGFTNVYDVSEGMNGRMFSPGWLKRGLPTEACTQC